MVSTDVWHLEHQEPLLLMYGKVAVRWAAADLLLAEILTTVLGNRSAATSLIFQTTGSGKQRFELFNNVIGASALGVEDRQNILALTKTLSSLLPERNDIIHSPLTISLAVDGDQLITTTSKVSRSGKVQDHSLKAVQAHIEKLGTVLAQLESFSTELDRRLNPPAYDLSPHTEG